MKSAPCWILLIALAGSCFAQTDRSIVFSSGLAGTYTVPNSPPYNTLSSYYYDFRIHGWTYPSTNGQLWLGPGSQRNGYFDVDMVNNGARIFNITPPDITLSSFSLSSPNIAISSISATNPMVLTLASAPFRLTMRAGSPVTFTQVAGSGCPALNNTTQTVAAVSGNNITLNLDGTGCSYTANSGLIFPTDIVVRIHRDLNLMQWIAESWDVGGEGYQFVSTQITQLLPLYYMANIPVVRLTGMDFAFIRWYSGTIAAGAIPPFGNTGGADLADWEFNGNGADSSGHGLTIGWTGSASYVNAPTYPPACSAGPPQSFRAGFVAALDGSRSFPLDGSSSLSYVWQQTAPAMAGIRPQRLRWSSHNSVKPTITGLVFGPADFQLTVTQSDGQSSSCTVQHGAVATDANGAVIAQTGNAQLDAAISQLLGPMVQLGKNSWPFYDQAAVNDAAVQMANLDTQYGATWDIPMQGTISITVGSAVVMGNGTNFLSTFCNANGTINSAYPSIAPVIWYPTNNPAVPGETGRLITAGSGPYLTGCASDTQMTLSAPIPSKVAACPTGQSPPCWLQYSNMFGPGGNAWHFTNAPANYYDSVAAYYALYYRSGQEIYLTNARKLADRFWNAPEYDKGNSYPYGFKWPPVYRANSAMGLVLRALDTSDGHPDMWAGLHKLWDSTIVYYTGRYPDPLKTYLDARENGYGLAQIAYCAMFDTDPAYEQTCRTAIKNSWATSGTGYLNVWPQAKSPDGGWLNIGGTAHNSWYRYNGVNPNYGTVTVTNGSRNVTCNAPPDCAFQSSEFAITSGIGGHPIWFTHTGSNQPRSNADGDPDVYCFQAGQPTVGCTLIDTNHFTLDRLYNEPGCDSGCVRGFAMDDTAGANGFIQNPYMEGILAFAFDLAGKAMACSAPGVPSGCDDATAATSRQAAVDAVNWMIKYGYRPSSYGMFYLADGPVCGYPVSDSNGWCAGGGAIASREYASDGLRGMMVAYAYSGDPSLKSSLDTLYSALWSKPGTNPVVASPDSVTPYDSNFDPGPGSWINPGYMANKLFGQNFGFSRQDNWPVIRNGGPLPMASSIVYISGRIADVPGAVSMQVNVIDPTGSAATPVVCTSSPCAITVHPGLGNPSIQVNYLSESGAVLHTGEPFTVTVQ